MPPSARITFRLTPTLEAMVADRVRQGAPVSDIVREALEQYFSVRQTDRQTHEALLSDSTLHVSDTLPDVVSALSATVSDMRLVVSDIRERLEHFEARLDTLSAGVRQRPTERQTECPTPHDDPAPAPTPEAPAAEVSRRPTPRPTPPATTPTPETLPPYILRIAEVAAEYDKLTLVELSQLLYDRNIYRAHDRKTGAEKPVNKGTLQHWLAQARQAGVL